MREFSKSKIELYFSDGETEDLVKRTFNNLIQGITGEQISAFEQALDTLSVLHTDYSVVVENYIYQ